MKMKDGKANARTFGEAVGRLQVVGPDLVSAQGLF